MKVGDVVVAIHPHVLACGSGRYRCAIVANLDPFALVSVEGDMLWMREDPNNVLELCQAAPEIVAVAVERYRKDMGLTSTPRYPGLNPEGLSDDILAMMPAGARLLECEGERMAFVNTAGDGWHLDLYRWRSGDRQWANGNLGLALGVTFLTTRPRGWWSRDAAKGGGL